MTLFIVCIAGTGLCYFLGLRSQRRFSGTVSGWVASLAIGVILALLYYAYSAYGLLFSLDTLLQ